jgi:hypothetical protein
VIEISPSLFDLKESSNVSLKDVKDLAEKILKGFKEKVQAERSENKEE